MGNNLKGRSTFKRSILIFCVLVVVVAGGVAGWKIRDHIEKKDRIKRIVDNHTSHSSTNLAGQGGVVSNSGTPASTPATTNQSQWTSSSSGVITLREPVANSTLLSGDTIEGTATIPAVQYRLVDNKAGVIAEGSLPVVNGVFSGTFNFQHYGSSGQLDIFSYANGTIGPEVNSINIPVEF